MNTVVIVGGGLGGLALALRLAAQGLSVTVCEKGPRLGGKMNRWSPGGYTFDTGASLITMPGVFADLFQAAGVRIEDHLDLMRVEPFARYVFPDGVEFTYSASLPRWTRELDRIERDGAQRFFRFMELGARLFHLSSATFLRRPVNAPPDAAVLRALRHAPLRHGWGNYHRTVASHFKSPHLVQLFDRYPTYVGSSPYACPATLAVIPYLEYAFGGWHIRGGLYRLIEALAGLAAERGVTFRCDAPVARIEHGGNRVKAVVLEDGEVIPADAVAVNADASTRGRLLGAGDAPPLPDKARSLSGVVMLLALNRKLPELGHHTVYFSADYPKEFADLFEDRRFPTDPTVYVNMPTHADPSMAPEGGESLFIMANAPALGAAGWSPETSALARERMLARLKAGGFPDVEDAIVTERMITPADFEDAYGTPGGAIYGTHSHGWRSAFFRPPNKDRRVGGLYYVGGSSHPGGGTPTVLHSARITSELILRHEIS
ncbi:MAG: phytoene desaturase family protein [Candidatus Hydrogenedentota bacterium]